MRSVLIFLNLASFILNLLLFLFHEHRWESLLVALISLSLTYLLAKS